ncbi:MAG: serine hydrolase domain-containing protein [Thermoanaerobaculia bacterium]
MIHRTLVLALALTAAARPAGIEAALPAIEERVEELRRELDLPGLAWGIVADGETVVVRTAGDRDVASGAPVTRDTIFRIASMTKSFTAVAILKLRDEGKLALDDPASRFIPELASMPLPTRDSGPITIRQLLTHTAGFPEDNPWGDRQLAVSDERVAAWLREGIPFSTAPGTNYEYSNYGFALLGRIVAAASGTSYTDYMNREILAPLGMDSSYWDASDVPDERRATAHRRKEGEFVAEEPLAHGAFGPMGGLWTSRDDLGRWVALMLSAFPARDDAETAPVARRTLREMHRATLTPPVSAGQRFPDGPLSAGASAYAFGLRSASDCEFDWIVGHSGGLPGFGSDMRWLPERGVGVFAMANVTYAPVGRITREVLSMLDRAGAIPPRPIDASPALEDAVARTARLVSDWDDELARELAADNLFLDEPLASRREAIRSLRGDLGACGAPEEIEPANALRATFRVPCEKGWLDVRITLAPTRPPLVQHLSVRRGKPLTARARRAAEAVVDAMRGNELSVEVANRTAIESTLEEARETFGGCAIERVLEGDGDTDVRIRLACDRGTADLDLELGEAGIERVDFLRPRGVRCWPERP